MKTILILTAALSLASCATQPDGTKTFLTLTGKDWAGIGQDAAKSAAQTAVISYGTRRAVTAAKNPVPILP